MVSRRDTTTVDGIFRGATSGAMYTIAVTNGVATTKRIALRDEFKRLEANNPTRTVIRAGDDLNTAGYLQLDATGRWGMWNQQTASWQPLAIEQGGTGARDAAGVRINIGAFYKQRAALEPNFNINNLTGNQDGVYYQPMTAYVTEANGYPAGSGAGHLIVWQNNANGGTGCRQEYYPFSNVDVWYLRTYQANTNQWTAWQPMVRPRNDDTFRAHIGLGPRNTPTFGHIYLSQSSADVKSVSGIVNGDKYSADGVLEHGYRIYSEVRNDNKAWLTIHLHKGAKGSETHKYLGFREDGVLDCPKYMQVGDLTGQLTNWGLGEWIRSSGAERGFWGSKKAAKMVVWDGGMDESGNGTLEWGVYNNRKAKWEPLPQAAGGTGATTLADAQNLFKVPIAAGVKDFLTLPRTAGMEDGKYYPIIVRTDPYYAPATGTDITIVTRSSSGNDPMNCATLQCHYRTGGWTDRGDSFYGVVNFYQNEKALLGMVAPTRGKQEYVAFYVEARAFPVSIYASRNVIEVFTREQDYQVGSVTDNQDGVKFVAPLQSADLNLAVLGDNNTNTRPIVDFKGTSGFYTGGGTQWHYIGTAERYAVMSKMNMPKVELWADGLDYLCYGSPRKALFSNAGFQCASDGTEDLTNGTFTSKCGNGAGLKGQAEFRSTPEAGQVIVRDVVGTAHRFYNFNKDGTFSAPGGFVCHTGADWNNQFGPNNPSKIMAGNVNGPEGSMVVGGLSVAFSGNYAFQMAGRLDQLYTRSIEGGNHRAWNKVIQHRGQGLGTNDLNDYKGDREGFYHQETNAQAALDKNYPCSQAGTLVVYRNYANVPESCVQEYTTYLGEKFLRYGTTIGGVFTWGHWQQLGGKGITLKTQGSNLEPEFTIHTGGGADVTNTSNMPSNTGRLYYWGNGADRKNVLEFQISDNSTVANGVFHCGAKADEAKSRYFAVNGTVECTTVSQSSDRDLKDNIEVIPNALEAIRKMKGYTYTLKENGMPYAGVIAQEVMEALPEAVGSFVKRKEIEGPTQDGIPLMTEERFYNVDYAAVTGLLVQVCREQDDKITALEEQVKKLTEVVTGLQEKLK